MCRTLHRLIQKQIELGRIVLPDNAPQQPQEEPTTADDAALEAAFHQQLDWLLAAHRGSPQAPNSERAPPPAAEDSSEDEDRAAAQEVQLKQQLQHISRSLWGTLTAGAASGRADTFTSRSKADYSYSPEAVTAMQQAGELNSTHHRRRDGHAAYVEACARDHLLRRGGAAPGKADK